MDAEALKIILDLKEENVLYQRALVDLLLSIASKKEVVIQKYGLDHGTISQILDIVSELKNKARLFDESQNDRNNRSDNAPDN